MRNARQDSGIPRKAGNAIPKIHFLGFACDLDCFITISQNILHLAPSKMFWQLAYDA